MKKTELLKRVLQAGVVAGICALIWIFETTPADVPAAAETVSETELAAAPETTTEAATATAPASPLEKKWGIQVMGVSLTNNDAAIQVQYAVVAPEKTALLAGTEPPYLLSEGTGEKLPMLTSPPQGAPSQGASRRTVGRMMRQAGQFPPPSSRLIAGRTYSLQIPNWGGAIRPGSKVSLVVGKLRQKDLTVE